MVSLFPGAFVCIVLITAINCETHFHFEKLVKMNETDEYFKYELKSIEKINATSFAINIESDLLVDLDDEWHVS